MRRNHGISIIELIMVIVTLVIVAFLLYTVIARYREARSGRSTSCSGNQRQIAACTQMYAQDHEENLPLANTIWSDIQADPSVLRCPKAKTLPNGFLYNNKLSGLNYDKINDPTKIFVTVDGETIYNGNIYFSSTNICYRHGDGAFASFADGHVESFKKTDAKLPWDLPVGNPAVKPAVKKKTKGNK